MLIHIYQKFNDSVLMRRFINCMILIWVIKSRRIRWTGHVACMGEMRNAYSILVGKPEGKRPLGRPKHRWADI
jgi:hypothetical protein